MDVEVVALCEIGEAERVVLSREHPGVYMPRDIAALPQLPAADLGLAGYPCPGNSSMGNMAGAPSGTDHPGTREICQLLRLLRAGGEGRPAVLLLENTVNCLTSRVGAAVAATGGRDNEAGGFFRWLARELYQASYTRGDWGPSRPRVSPRRTAAPGYTPSPGGRSQRG